MLQENQPPIKYPRHRFVRGVLRLIGRLILPILFHIEKVGGVGLPKNGPIILVGNHNAAMEAVLMSVYSPWQVEFLGAGDLPQEKITEFFEAIYKYIPIRRGHMDRQALQKALAVLEAGGFLGIFPEGGIWNPGQMQAQTGVAWLSYRSQAPVLPIGFGGTIGALDAALKFKRPRLTIRMGELIPAAKLTPGLGRKTYFEEYANHVMAQVRNLLPEDDPALDVKIKDERFELEIRAQDAEGVEQAIPPGLQITYPQALSKFLHRPMILKIFRANLKLSIDALERLHEEPNPGELKAAIEQILDSINSKYTYLLTYRFGPKESEAMLQSLEELHAIAKWAEENNYQLRIIPIRKFYSTEEGKEILQTKQEVSGSWM